MAVSRLIRIGDRDDWICGICRDPARRIHRPSREVTILASELIVEDVPPGEGVDGLWEEGDDDAPRPYNPLAPSIDHILPRSRGGTNDDGNLQIAHLRCNLLKHDDARPPSAEYARARLSLTLNGTPVSLRVWERERVQRRQGVPARQPFRRLPPPWMFERRQVAVEPWRLLLRYQVWRMVRRYRRRQARYVRETEPE